VAENNAVVRVYDARADTERIVKELESLGLDINNVSFVGKDYHTQEEVIGADVAGDCMKIWCKLATIWPGLWNVMLGAAFYFIPGIGAVIVVGPLVSWIVRALEGGRTASGGLSALGAGLQSIGIPRNSIVEYETALKSDEFLVISHETADEWPRTRASWR
jgi:hypothetical protein